jgi:hypothetical protein
MAPLPPPATGTLVEGAAPELEPEPCDRLALSGVEPHPVENALNAAAHSHARAHREE